MLGIDHQRANIRAVEPGADSGVFGRQWRGRIQGTESRGGLRLGESNAPAATICGAEAQRAGMGAALRGEDDGAEPGADDTAVVLVGVADRRNYRYRFNNPLMQPFAIMQGFSMG